MGLLYSCVFIISGKRGCGFWWIKYYVYFCWRWNIFKFVKYGRVIVLDVGNFGGCFNLDMFI